MAFSRLVLATAALGLVASAANAQTGATLTPNRHNFMVNKDIQAQRWTINLNLASDDPASILNATGNIFDASGGPPQFVLCQVRPDSTGTLNDPASTFRFTCRGTDACQTTASQCARDSWRPIDDDVQIPASFFLPPGGLGDAASAAVAAPRDAVAPSTAAPGSLERVLRVVAGAWSNVLAWLAGGPELVAPRPAHAQGTPRGATLSLDRLNFLVNKDVGDERWSMSLNFVPVPTAEGGVTTRLESVTGNVFQPDGSPPSFVFCTTTPGSTGTLEDPTSEFRFSCQATSACTSTARDCAANAWVQVPEEIALPASFFLPPGGLPATAQSDPDIVIIGRTSDPPSIITSDFTLEDASAADAERVAGGCPQGASCLVPRLGSCQNVRGRVVQVESIGCGCFIENVSGGCVGCGNGASGQCGGECAFPVGDSTARGVCLPFSRGSSDCACFAVGAQRQGQELQSCGGPLAAGCPGDRCCVDDPRDGCDPLAGNAGCFGVCVAAEGCDPAVQQCGQCLAPGGQFCGNNRREGSEACDGSDLAGESCESLGFPGGGFLGCGPRCDFDTRGCTQGSNTPPTIVAIDFPPVIDPHGGPVPGTVEFSDPEGDVVRARFEPVSGNLQPFTFDPGVFGRASGSFGFFVNCNGNVADYVVAVTLEDQQGNVSEPETFSFSCEVFAECGNGRVEQGEACDPPGDSGGCSSGFLCTNDCTECVSAISCEGRCCPGFDPGCRPPGAACFCDEACRQFQDCCDDVSIACGF